MKSTARTPAGALTNAPTARTFPAPGDDRALAAYWGWEAGQAMLRVSSGTSTDIALDCDHAWRCAKVAWYRALKYRNIRKELQ